MTNLNLGTALNDIVSFVGEDPDFPDDLFPSNCSTLAPNNTDPT